MDVIMHLIVLSSITYLMILIFNVRINKLRLRQQINRFLDDPKVDEKFLRAGVHVKSRLFNIVRYIGSTLYLSQFYLVSILRQESFAIYPIVITLLFLVVTSPHDYMPFGSFIRFLTNRRNHKKDGEWISFLKLYESNRLRESYIEFSLFCKQISPYFDLIQKELLILSEITLNKGLHAACDWLVSQYPKNHPFMDYIRTIIVSTDQVDHENAQQFLQSQNETIASLCTDYYNKRWTAITGIASIFNVLPIVLILFSILIITLMRLWATKTLIIY